MNNKISSDGVEPELMETDADNVTAPGMDLEDPTNGHLDHNMEEVIDTARPEATFSFNVPNFSKIKDNVLSPATIVRNLPWKIMAMQRTSTQERMQKSLGFFLQCNGDSESTIWTCDAVADLRLLNYLPNVEPFSRKITHHFNSKENDWGFSHFMLWNDVLDPEKGYIKDDTIVLQVHVVADAPHGVAWDSKKHTGFVGLKNQGATCYMNSLLQTLYFTNQLRKAVYKMPTESDDSSKSVALALQRVFHELQFADKPVGTKKLTKSFGWETMDSFMQHDVQEFLRVLLDKLESKMKGTCVEGTVPKLFEGKMRSFIKCKDVDYESKRTETYYDIQLNIKGKKNIDESFQDYVATEALEGDNKYDAGEYGLQEAEKGVVFESFPPVLHLHLMRFQYDPITDCSVKFNDRFEFDEKINLDKFLNEAETTPASYTLHAVLVHSGDNHGGHYVVFINPKGDGEWCKFDDDVVSGCPKEAAIESNYGGHGEDDSNLTIRSCTNAYMLVYIRDSELPVVLQDVTINDIPQELTDRLREEKTIEQIKRKERSEAHLYMLVHVVLEDEMQGHQGNDLFNPDKAHYRQYRVMKRTTLPQLIGIIAENMKYSVNQIRPWPMFNRQNGARRPSCLEIDDLSKPLSDLAENHSPWLIFLEVIQPDSMMTELPPFDKDHDVLLFFKYYDPRHKKMHYAGHYYAHVNTTVQHLIPTLNERAGLPLDTKLALFEERKQNLTVPIDKWNEPLEKVLDDLTDGDIICFQKDRMDDDLYELPTCKDYFEDIFYRMEVMFCDKAVNHEHGFLMDISTRMTYEQMADAVAQRLDTSPNLIQFFKSANYKDSPGAPYRPRDGSLKELLAYSKFKPTKKVYYQHLSIPIDEMENKKQMKCLWVPENLKEEKEMTFWPNKNGCISDLIDEAKKQVELNGTGKLRVEELTPFKPITIYKDTQSLASLCSPAQGAVAGMLRIEEVPHDEMELAEDELLVPVAHYQKDLYSPFGVPFLVKVKDGEPFARVKARILKKLDVTEKEFETYKFAIVAGAKAKIISDETGETMSLPELRKAWIGLDHVNKAPKRSRFNYLEKAIKIYN